MQLLSSSIWRLWGRDSETGGRYKLENTSQVTEEEQGQNIEVQELISAVTSIHYQLSSLRNLEPRCEVNALFGKLVEISTRSLPSSLTSKILSSPEIQSIIPSLHKLCSDAEYQLESHWSTKISGSVTPNAAGVQNLLESFPYYSNYVDLTRLELCTLQAVNGTDDPLRKFAFIGSGPLPLTSLCLLSSLSGASQAATILNIDSSSHAIELSRTLCSRLATPIQDMSFFCSDAEAETLELKDFDVVYLAALVGSSQLKKEDVLKKVVGKMKVGALIVIRSADRLRGLMYPVFDPTSKEVLKCLELCAVVHPYDHVVNSVIVGRVKEKQEGLDT